MQQAGRRRLGSHASTNDLSRNTSRRCTNNRENRMKPAQSAGILVAGKLVMKHRWGKARCTAGDHIQGEKLPQHRKKHLSYGEPSSRQGFGPDEPKPPEGRCRAEQAQASGDAVVASGPAMAKKQPPGHGSAQLHAVRAWMLQCHGLVLSYKGRLCQNKHRPEGYGEQHEHIWS